MLVLLMKYLKKRKNNEQKKLNINDKLSIIVEDLAKQKILASIHSNKRIKSASTIKVPILHAYMIQRFRSNIRESPWEKKLIEDMIRFSSNPRTNSVIHLLGGTNNIQSLLNQTKVYKQLRLVEYFPVDGRAYRNKISVADLNRLFVKIWYKLIFIKNLLSFLHYIRVVNF